MNTSVGEGDAEDAPDGAIGRGDAATVFDNARRIITMTRNMTTSGRVCIVTKGEGSLEKGTLSTVHSSNRMVLTR